MAWRLAIQDMPLSQLEHWSLNWWNWMEIASQQSNSTKLYLSTCHLSLVIVIMIIMTCCELWLLWLVTCDCVWILNVCHRVWNHQIMQWTAALKGWLSDWVFSVTKWIQSLLSPAPKSHSLTSLTSLTVWQSVSRQPSALCFSVFPFFYFPCIFPRNAIWHLGLCWAVGPLEV